MKIIKSPLRVGIIFVNKKIKHIGKRQKKELERMKGNNHEGKRILIVDEDPDLFNYLAGEARKFGLNYQFEKTDTFSQAVDSIFSGRYDLVMLDFPGIEAPT